MPGRVVLVSPRPPRVDGRGDQRRAWEILKALATHWDVQVVSWLPESGHATLPTSARAWVRLIRLSWAGPLRVALMQATAPAILAQAFGPDDVTIFVTSRAVPRGFEGTAIVDFVDDYNEVAIRRARRSAPVAREFWRWEASRGRRYDRALAASAAATVAHTDADARSIAANVLTIPLSPITAPMPDVGEKVAFIGNLHYRPNHDAAAWICQSLAPYLASHGIQPGRILVCGRRPSADLKRIATKAGVDFRADVGDVLNVFREAAVVISPMDMGGGAQYKVIDAVAARRATVLTSIANLGLGLEDGKSALVRSREAQPFGDAILALLASPSLRSELAGAAEARLRHCMPDTVAEDWRALVAAVDGRLPQLPPIVVPDRDPR